MPGPASAGLFIYAKDVPRLSAFYRALLGMDLLYTTAEIAVLQSPDMQLVLHALPPQYADAVVIETPPRRRENTALKFFFTVPGIDAARATAERLGGKVLDGRWAGSGFLACNAVDPEGNIFQLRERAPA